VKCNIPGLIEGSKEQLPWVFRRSNSLLGGTGKDGGFAVPKMGSELEVIFPFEDPYTPVYVGYWESRATHPTAFDEDYPNILGYADEEGNSFSLNRKSQEVKVTHSSGTFVLVDKDGNLNLEGVAKLVSTIKDEINLTGEKGLTAVLQAALSLEAGEEATITAPKVEMGSESVGVLDNRVKQDQALAKITVQTPVGPAAPVSAAPQFSQLQKNTQDLNGIKA